MKTLVSPSILDIDFSRLAEECLSLEQSGADMLHCDVMDGKFVPNLSFGADVVQKVSQTVRLPLDVHLMVQNPLQCVRDFVTAGADIVTFHVEAADDTATTAQLIRSLGAKVGISVKPATPVESLIPFADMFDLVLIMTVEPGFGGQKFMTSTVEKIQKARQLFPDKMIQVDGGINDVTAKTATKAGADVLVSGSYIIKSQNRTEAIKSLRNL